VNKTATEIIEHFDIVIVGHVDHGKSTVIGRLYADTGSLPDGKLEKVKAICEQQGKAFEYAFLFDALLEEQEQGITIDTARTFFTWGSRKYTIIDAPGHKEFLKNMISGASRAEGALLVIDAKEGVREQSRQHGYMLSLLGIKQITVLVNKMDLVDYKEEVFRNIEKEYRAFLSSLNVNPLFFCPISAREGDNIAKKGPKMAWFDGPTVLQALEAFSKEKPKIDMALRFPVQDVYKFDGRRIIAGRINSGKLKVGDRLVFSPSNKTTCVKTIEEFNRKTPSVEAFAGQSTGITLDEQIFIERGEIISAENNIPLVSSLFRANIFWMGRKSLKKGNKYLLRLCTKEIECEILEIHRGVNPSDLNARECVTAIAKNEVAEVTIRAKSDVAFDLYSDYDCTGRFVLVEDYDVSGGGIIMEYVSDDQENLRKEARQRDIHWVKGEVKLSDRAECYGHRAAVVLFSGTDEMGKTETARKLEKKLVKEGRHAYLLDGENLRLGLDLDISETDSSETMRRLGEVTRLLLDTGMIIIIPSNNFSEEDFQRIKTLIHPAPLVSIYVMPKEASPPGDCDLLLCEIRNHEAAANEITEKLKEKGILANIVGPSSFCYTI
jgi:bifunctional enzyme CysN/CysC